MIRGRKSAISSAAEAEAPAANAEVAVRIAGTG
jgi:hypothetical protein